MQAGRVRVKTRQGKNQTGEQGVRKVTHRLEAFTNPTLACPSPRAGPGVGLPCHALGRLILDVAVWEKGASLKQTPSVLGLIFTRNLGCE